MKRATTLIACAFSMACGTAEPAAPQGASATAPATEPGATEPGAEPSAPEEAPTPTSGVRAPAPDFELQDQAGATHSLASLRGKIVVLEWINPQCPYVQRHYRSRTMAQLVEAFPSERVAWLAIDSSHFVQPADSERWRAEHGLTYPILQDPSGAVGRAYDATTTPNMYVIDEAGVLRYRGAIDDDPRGQSEDPRGFVREAVQALLDGKEVPTPETQPYGCTVKYEEA
ncbi:MAG: redoxin domain-containing protein [Myxococcales bacterium]|nr:redoxin domain-containing protein [Myxococcales bacterium]